MLREIFKQVSYRDSPYKDIYYLTDTEIRFSIYNQDKFITISLRVENDRYIVYGFETTKNNTIIRHKSEQIDSIDFFWIWYNNFYNNLL
jgi:hypothetical protein